MAHNFTLMFSYIFSVLRTMIRLLTRGKWLVSVKAMINGDDPT